MNKLLPKHQPRGETASTAKTYNDRGQLATEATTYAGQTYTVTYHYL
ncbi:MAG: hypothetical protein Q8M16_09335 [Pirellulaceae bacterium]|nr:hypothetical protein [Pirellulaceae bacterium]